MTTMLSALISIDAAGALPLLDASAAWLIDTLIRVSIDGALVALPVWLVCRFVPTLPASARTWLWWCVSLKMLLSVTALPAVQLPVLPSSWTVTAPPVAAGLAANSTPIVHSQGTELVAPANGSEPGLSSAAGGRVPPTPHSADGPLVWTLRGLVMAWAMWVVLQIGLLAREALQLRALVGRAHPVDQTLADEHEDLASDLGLRRVPSLLASADVSVPQVVGTLRPTVLLPASHAARMSAQERGMVLCHELAHVRRGDLVLGWGPALAERLLARHPIARLAAREYALAREAACDALVLRTLDTEPRDYGQLLVRLGVSAPAARIAAAGASPTAHLLRRRLHMLQHASPLSATAIWRPALVVAILALVPLRPVAGKAPDAAASPAPALVSAGTITSTTVDRAERATTPAPLVVEQESERRAREQETNREREMKGRRDRSWVYIRDGDTLTMSGEWRDAEIARRLRGSTSGNLFYFRQGNDAYVIDDKQTLEQIAAILAPQMELGQQQGELGAKQGVLGAEQGKLGEKQGALGAQQAELGKRQAEMSAQLASANAEMLKVAAERMRERTGEAEALKRRETEAKAMLRDAERQMRELSERQEMLGAQQGELGREQGALGEKQGRLGDEQARLGELQRLASEKADRQISELIARAISVGVAKSAK